MASPLPAAAPFLLHILIELPAALMFFTKPDSTLKVPQPHAHDIIQAYAVLLVVTVAIAGTCAAHVGEPFTHQISLALAVYHLAPIRRATIGMRDGWRMPEHERPSVRRPVVFIGVHLLCFVALLVDGLAIWASESSEL